MFREKEVGSCGMLMSLQVSWLPVAVSCVSTVMAISLGLQSLPYLRNAVMVLWQNHTASEHISFFPFSCVGEKEAGAEAGPA